MTEIQDMSLTLHFFNQARLSFTGIGADKHNAIFPYEVESMVYDCQTHLSFPMLTCKTHHGESLNSLNLLMVLV